MGWYHIVIGVATMFVIIMLWGILAYTNDLLSDTFYNITPSSINNYTINQTDVRAQFTYESDVFFYSIIFIVIIILAWIIKKSIQEREFRSLYGG